MISYTFSIVDVLLGASRTNAPFIDVNIFQSNKLNYSITITNNQVELDNNLYELKTQSKEQFDALYSLLESEHRVNSFLMKNHYTYNGQYIELVYQNQLIQIDLIVKSLPIKKQMAC